jgi:hypothetical protein
LQICPCCLFVVLNQKVTIPVIYPKFVKPASGVRKRRNRS